VIQLRTIKVNNFNSASQWHFGAKLTPDLDSGCQNTSENSSFDLFPWCFWPTKFFGWFERNYCVPIMNIWLIYDNNTASIAIIARCETAQCCFCLRTAHSAALPVKPNLYALMKQYERLMKRRITSTGQASRTSNAAFFAWLKFCFIICLYRYLHQPQY
jgi:hypothetical protein